MVGGKFVSSVGERARDARSTQQHGTGPCSPNMLTKATTRRRHEGTIACLLHCGVTLRNWILSVGATNPRARCQNTMPHMHIAAESCHERGPGPIKWLSWGVHQLGCTALLSVTGQLLSVTGQGRRLLDRLRKFPTAFQGARPHCRAESGMYSVATSLSPNAFGNSVIHLPHLCSAPFILPGVPPCNAVAGGPGGAPVPPIHAIVLGTTRLPPAHQR